MTDIIRMDRKTIAKMDLHTLEKKVEAYRVIINRPLIMDANTYRNAVAIYGELRDEYKRRQQDAANKP